MDLLTMILGGTGALAGAVAVRVIASDIGDNVPVLAKRLIIRAAKRLPGAENTRYQEEWLAHLNECRGSIPKLLHAIKCLTCARNLQRILAAPNSVSPVFEAGALFSIIDNTPETGATITKLRDLLNVDHLVYHSLPLGASPSADPYIRLTYPASWIKRYLQMEYLDNDPVVREGLLRTLPFVWSELKIQSAAEASFLADALAHGVGPYGLSIPVQSKHGHRALFSISSASIPAAPFVFASLLGMTM
jgi:hypothetical protein